MAKKIEFTEEEIKAVIRALERNEKWLSDGFGWYTGGNRWTGEEGEAEKAYNSRMRKIAINVLKELRKHG